MLPKDSQLIRSRSRSLPSFHQFFLLPPFPKTPVLHVPQQLSYIPGRGGGAAISVWAVGSARPLARPIGCLPAQPGAELARR